MSFKSIEKFKLAEKAYKNCLKLNPDYFFGIINYANFKEEINQIKESIELNLKGLKSFPTKSSPSKTTKSFSLF